MYLHGYGVGEMTTAVQVADETRRLLEKLKNEKEPGSYDEVIRWLFASEAGLPRSTLGAARGSRGFERETEGENQP